MKRYVLFAIFNNTPKGGAKDYGASFSTPEQARIYLTKATAVYEGKTVQFQLFDCKKEKAISFDYDMKRRNTSTAPTFGKKTRIAAIVFLIFIIIGMIAAFALPLLLKH